MLYDILPPIVFFASLGGVVFITSRVVARLRRQRTVAPANMARSARNLAALVGPSQKSVHVIGSRLALAINLLNKLLLKAKQVALSARGWPSGLVRLTKRLRPRGFSVPVPARLRRRREKTTPVTESVTKPKKEEGKSPSIARASAAVFPLPGHWRSIRRGVSAGSQKIKGAVSSIAAQAPLRKAKPVLRLTSRKTGGGAEPDSKVIGTQPEVSPAADATSLRSGRRAVSARVSLDKILSSKQRDKKKASPLKNARRYIKACRYASAEKTLVPFLVKNPRHARAYMLLGQAALGRQNWEEAAEIFEQVVTIAPDTKDCYTCLGYAHYKAGNLTKAMETLKIAHDADPDNVVIIKRLLAIARCMDNAPLQHSLSARLKELEPLPVRRVNRKSHQRAGQPA